MYVKHICAVSERFFSRTFPEEPELPNVHADDKVIVRNVLYVARALMEVNFSKHLQCTLLTYMWVCSV